MKKIIFPILAFGLLLIASCSKSPNNSPGGSWNLEQTTYNASKAVGSTTANTLIATGSSSTTAGGLTINFLTYPTMSGYYTVVANGYPNTSSQVGITATVGNTVSAVNYSSTGTGSSSQVYVAINNGKLNVTGTGIEMRNNTNASDSTPLTLNITQTQ